MVSSDLLDNGLSEKSTAERKRSSGGESMGL